MLKLLLIALAMCFLKSVLSIPNYCTSLHQKESSCKKKSKHTSGCIIQYVHILSGYNHVCLHLSCSYPLQGHFTGALYRYTVTGCSLSTVLHVHKWEKDHHGSYIIIWWWTVFATTKTLVLLNCVHTSC